MRLVRLPDGAAHGELTKALNAAGSTIGRSPECDLVLDDPLRLVSRRHAWIVPSGPSGARLHCISTSASLIVNGNTVPPGGECEVTQGDRIAIGAFELVLEGRPHIDTTLAELARHVAPPPVQAAPAVSAPPASVQQARPPAQSSISPPAPSSAEPAVDSRPAFQPSRLDKWFDLETVADPLGAEPLGAASPAADGLAQKMPLPAARPQAEAPSSADAAGLRLAFLRGAGLGDDRALGSDPAWAEHVGALLRSLTDGHFELLRSRAATKQSIRAAGTQIVARENNPLKFAPDATECLRLLLQQSPRQGFLAPLDALRESQQDLQMHQLAMVAGMRAAVAELIQRLGPTAIEQSAGPPTGLSRLLPALREAALWRRHCEHHTHLMAHLDEAFEAAFGREFLVAYEAQARRAGNRPG
jgi:type VI secretion system FHA domain protein